MVPYSPVGTGVNPSPSTSIRDVARSVGDAIQERSKAAYQALDTATGGRFQRFEDVLRNVNEKLRETVGLDDDAEDVVGVINPSSVRCL